MKKIIISCAILVCVTGCMTQPIASLDANRIIVLARQAIAEQRGDVDADKLEFTDITCRYDAKQYERISVGFRHSPVSEITTTSNEDSDIKKTKTRYQAIVVQMDKNGNVLSVSGKATSLKLKFESKRKKTAQRRTWTVFFKSRAI